MAISCGRLGDVARENGDMDTAKEAYKQGYELAKKVLDTTSTVEARRDLAISCNRLGDIAYASGDIKVAERYYKQSYELLTAVANETGLVAAIYNLISVNMRMSTIAKSNEGKVQYVCQALELAEGLYKCHADYKGWYKKAALDLSNLYEEVGDAEGYQRMQEILKSIS